jgi:hypothetical protein
MNVIVHVMRGPSAYPVPFCLFDFYFISLSDVLGFYHNHHVNELVRIWWNVLELASSLFIYPSFTFFVLSVLYYALFLVLKSTARTYHIRMIMMDKNKQIKRPEGKEELEDLN